jgi:hypothetical protein
MTELSESTKALLGAFTDWDATYGADVTVYSEGLCMASVCTRLDDEQTDAAMAARPTGSSGGWQRSTDPTFAGGEPNPCPCDAEPQARRHVLYEA